MTANVHSSIEGRRAQSKFYFWLIRTGEDGLHSIILANPSNRALQELFHILCEITNVANDIGDNMHDIFMQEKLTKADGSAWIATVEDINFFREMIEKLHEAELELRKFSEKLVLEN